MEDDPKASGLQQPYFIQKDRLKVPHLFEHVHLSVYACLHFIMFEEMITLSTAIGDNKTYAIFKVLPITSLWPIF